MLEQTVINRMLRANDTAGAVLRFFPTVAVKAGPLEHGLCPHTLRVHHCAGCGDDGHKLAALERVAKRVSSAAAWQPPDDTSRAECELSASHYATVEAFAAQPKLRGRIRSPRRRLSIQSRREQPAWCVAVVSDYNRTGSVRLIASLARRYGCAVHVMSKSGAGCAGYPELPCTVLPNMGRDAGAALEYVTRHYDNLPDNLIFSGASIRKHDRMRRLTALLRLAATSRTTDGVGCTDFDCASFPPFFRPTVARTNFSSLNGFGVGRWGRNQLVPAMPRPFGAWFSAHVGDYARHGADIPCYNVIFRSTRAMLRLRPRSSYESLARQVCDLVPWLAGRHAHGHCRTLAGG
jgi:hypothetical protein